MGSQAPIYRVCMRNSRLVVIPLTDATYNLASPGFPPNRKQIVFYRVQIVFYKDRITRRYYREAYRLIVSWALHPIQASTLKQTCNICFVQHKAPWIKAKMHHLQSTIITCTVLYVNLLQWRRGFQWGRGFQRGRGFQLGTQGDV